jgi:hypothetical protein
MLPAEQRAGLGFEILGQGKKVFGTLYTEKGSTFVPIHLIPRQDGRVESNGDSSLILGSTGEEIVWRPKAAPLNEIGNLFRDYVAANGWKGSPEALKRLSVL